MSVGRSSCAVELDLPQNRFVVGEPGAASMQVRNTSHRRMLPLRMELDVAGLAVSVPIPSLPGGAGHIVEVPLPTRRRAVVDLGPLRAVRGDVFGLIRRVVQWPVHRQVFVHPRTVRPSSSLPGYVHDLEGEESTKRTASDLSFHTLREYVPGDDRRFIHWKSSARNGTLQVREFLQTHRSHGRPSCCPAAVSTTTGPAAGTSVRDSDLESGDDGGPEPTAEGIRDEAGGRPPQPGARGRVRDRRRLRGVDGRRTGPAAARRGDRRRRPRDPRGDARTAFSTSSVRSNAAVDAPDLIFQTRRLVRRHPRVSLVVLVFGSSVGAAQIRAAVRSCPPGASVLALRARSTGSPHPPRMTGSDAARVLTLADVDDLPPALRAAG